MIDLRLSLLLHEVCTIMGERHLSFQDAIDFVRDSYIDPEMHELVADLLNKL